MIKKRSTRITIQFLIVIATVCFLASLIQLLGGWLSLFPIRWTWLLLSMFIGMTGIAGSLAALLFEMIESNRAEDIEIYLEDYNEKPN